MWKVVLTKTFLLQFLNLVRDKQDYVLDSIKFLKDVLNLDTQPEFDFVDEYDDGKIDNQPFPLTYHVDYDAKRIYLINIEQSYRDRQ